MKKNILIFFVLFISSALLSQSVAHENEQSALYQMSCFHIVTDEVATYKIYQQNCGDEPIVQGIFFINESDYLQDGMVYTIEVETFSGTYYFYNILLPPNSTVNLLCVQYDQFKK